MGELREPCLVPILHSVVRWRLPSTSSLLRRFLYIVLLSSFAYSAQPAAAQVRPDEIARVRREVRRSEEISADAAGEWARVRRLPSRISQRNGHLVELVGMSGRRPIYLTQTNEMASVVTGTRYLHPGGRLGLDLTGAGLEIGIWDGGRALMDHQELTGRVANPDNSAVDDHATHVAGTLAAAGIQARARGMAFESSVRSYSWINDATEMSNEADRGLLVSNHSYAVVAGWYFGDIEDEGDKWYWLGDPTIDSKEDYIFGWYDLGAVQFDRVVYTGPYFLPVVAAGNERVDRGPRTGTYRALDESGNFRSFDVSTRPIPADGSSGGFDTISGAGLAKNVLTVGSVALSDVDGSLKLSSFSSFGPTDDGRIKPDLVGLGEHVYSLSSSGNSAYQLSSGTSMATPNVSGSLLLLQEHHRDVFGEYMRAATLKGLAIHTATDLGLPGPDYSTGWGVLNAEAAAAHVTSSMTNPAGITEALLSEGSTFLQEIVVDHPGPVRITLSWTDPPSLRHPLFGPASLDNPAPHLKNDLDVRLIHRSSGVAYAPFVLDPADPQSAALTGDNMLDPLEQIYAHQADTGAYVIQVTHKGNLFGGIRQAFSLLVSGGRDDSVPVGISHLSVQATLEGITLTWMTLFENRAGTFVIERGPAPENSAKVLGDDRFIAVGMLDAPASGAREYSFTDPWTISGRYVYRIVHDDGLVRYVAGSANVNLATPERYDVLSIFPNPFRDDATMILDLPKTQFVKVEVFDAIGRRMTLLHEGMLEAGRHRLDVAGSTWPPGVYFARVSTPNGTTGSRMVLVR